MTCILAYQYGLKLLFRYLSYQPHPHPMDSLLTPTLVIVLVLSLGPVLIPSLYNFTSVCAMFIKPDILKRNVKSSHACGVRRFSRLVSGPRPV